MTQMVTFRTYLIYEAYHVYGAHKKLWNKVFWMSPGYEKKVNEWSFFLSAKGRKPKRILQDTQWICNRNLWTPEASASFMQNELSKSEMTNFPRGTARTNKLSPAADGALLLRVYTGLLSKI